MSVLFLTWVLSTLLFVVSIEKLRNRQRELEQKNRLLRVRLRLLTGDKGED